MEFTNPDLLDVTTNGNTDTTDQPAQQNTPASPIARPKAGAPATPMLPVNQRPDANNQLVEIEDKFRDIMQAMGLDLTDDSLKGTPHRIAKMFVHEIFAGLRQENAPKIAVFDNVYNYGEMLVEKNIQLHSTCEHHFLPILGMAHVAYIPRDKVVGLSKLNRVVDFYARRPQVQERLTQQIAHHLMDVLQTPDVAVLIDAEHMCVKLRGIEDPCSSTVTSAYYGAFKEASTRDEFLRYCGI